jgi:hypothetical protein
MNDFKGGNSTLLYLKKLLDRNQKDAYRVAIHLNNQGIRLFDIKEKIERYLTLDDTPRRIFLYLLFEGAVKDFERAWEQTDRIQRIDNMIDTLNEHFNIPVHVRNLIDYKHAWDVYRMSVSTFQIKGQWFIQET